MTSRQKDELGEKVVKTEQEWRAQLTPEQFAITRNHETEPAFSGCYWDTKTQGTYECVCCSTELFGSDKKYDSGTGWPSFSEVLTDGRVTTRTDNSYGMVRTEVLCATCDAHLGHVFDDGPAPAGQRYCLNSASLRLKPAP